MKVWRSNSTGWLPNKLGSLTAHAADPDSKSAITFAPDVCLTFPYHHPEADFEAVLLVMVLRPTSNNKTPKNAKHCTRFGGLLGDCWGTVPGVFWDCSGTVLGLFSDCSGTGPGLFQDCSGTGLGLFWDCSGTVLGLFWDCSYVVQERGRAFEHS